MGVDIHETGRKPWSRQHLEDTTWFQRFHDYKLLGPTRSVSQVYRDWKRSNGKPVKDDAAPPSVWYESAKKYNWAERAALWDDAERQRVDEEYQKAKKDEREAYIAMLTTARRLLARRISHIAQDESSLDSMGLDRVMGAASLVRREQRIEFDEETAKKIELSGRGGGAIKSAVSLSALTNEQLAMIEQLMTSLEGTGDDESIDTDTE